MKSDFDVEESRKKKKGVYCSSCCVWTTVIFVIAALVAEGLLVGFLARPTCKSEETVNPVPVVTTTEKPPISPTPDMPDVPAFLLDHRLRDNLIPIDYTLTLRPVFEMVSDTYYYYGKSTVSFICVIPTDMIVLNSKELDTFDPPVMTELVSGKSVNYEGPEFFVPNNYMYFTLDGPCTKDMVYHLEFPRFRGELNADLDGFYRSVYTDPVTGKQVVIATSQMETEGARRTFPCFDEPEYKATFETTMQYQDPYMSVTNMPEAETTMVMIDGDQWTSVKYEKSPIMSTYLLAMTVTDFGYVEAQTVNGTQTRIYARKTPVNNNEVDYAGSISPIILDTYSVYLKEVYPLPKSDQMCVPDFDAGAMENWGLVIYRETYLLYDEMISSVTDQYRIVSVIAHELAHQWFGNLVTCAYWNEIWLNEGFATYFSYIGTYGVYDFWDLDNYFVIDDLKAALYADDSSGSHPLTHRAGLFSTVTYSKGASILRMVRNFLGEDTFITAIQNYLKEFSYDTAQHQDLFQAWIDQAEVDEVTAPHSLFDIFESWVMQMGFPLITLEKTGNKITASQEIFLIDADDTPAGFENEEANKYNYKWYVPFSYKTLSELDGTNNKTYQWMDLSGSMTIDTDEDILANVGAVGFYRVNYDEGMWSSLIAKMKSSDFKEISIQNRAQLIDDAFAVTRAGILNVETPLELSQYLGQEHDYFPWSVFYDDIFYYSQMLATSPIYGHFSEWVLSLAVPGLYSHYGLVDTDTSDQAFTERKARGLGVDIGCYFGAPDCIQNAIAMYKNWMENPTELVSATYRSDVYCTAIAYGGVAEWDFAWEQYLASDSATHQSTLRYGMSCSRDAWIINRYIDRACDNTLVRYQDQSRTLSYIGGQEANKYVVYAYATNNYERLYGAVGGLLSSMLSSAKNRFSTSFDIQVIEDFREVAGSNWDSTLDSYIRTVQKNMQWRENYEDKIADWLGVPGDIMRTDKQLFKVTNPMPPRPERDEDMFVGPRHQRPSSPRGDKPL